MRWTSDKNKDNATEHPESFSLLITGDRRVDPEPIGSGSEKS